MDLGPEEKFLKFWEVSRNRALKRFAQFLLQPAANGLTDTSLEKNFATGLSWPFLASSVAAPYLTTPLLLGIEIIYYYYH